MIKEMKKIVFVLTLLCGLVFTSCHNEPVQPKVSFSFTITDLGPNYVAMTAVPSDSLVYYCFEVYSAAYVDSIGSDSLLAVEDIEYIENMVQYLNEKWNLGTDFVNFIYQGTGDEEWGSLTPSTDYVAVAFCVDTATHTYYGDFSKFPFRTLDE